MPRSYIYFFSGLLIFLLFLSFSYLVHKDSFTTIDFDTTVKLQDRIPRRVDGFFSFFSTFGNFEVLLLVFIAVLVFSRKIVAGIIAFSVFIGFHVLELFGKVFVTHPPPPEFMLRTDHPFDLPQFHVRSEYSYPSGHSGRAIFLTVFLLFFLWRAKKIAILMKVSLTLVIVLLTSIMLISRIYLGEHWISDVIGGVLLALGLSLISLTFYKTSGSQR